MHLNEVEAAADAIREELAPGTCSAAETSVIGRRRT
jgi:hypothetical protein